MAVDANGTGFWHRVHGRRRAHAAIAAAFLTTSFSDVCITEVAASSLLRKEEVMESMHIDPGKGEHAAADLSDGALRYLFELVLWELAIRTDAEEFNDCLSAANEARRSLEERLVQARGQRELMRFAAEVMHDLERIPVIEESEPTTGMYL